MKEKIKLVIVFMIGTLLSIIISIYTSNKILSKEIKYEDKKELKSTSDPDYISGVYSSSSTLTSKYNTLNTTVSNIGTYYESSSYSVTSVPNKTVTKFGSFTLPNKGLYIVQAYTSWTTSFGGSLEYVSINGSSYSVRGNAGSGGGLQVTVLYVSSASETITCEAYQESGSTKTLSSRRCNAVRIK